MLRVARPIGSMGIRQHRRGPFINLLRYPIVGRIETQMEIFSCAIATLDSLADCVGWKIASLMLARIRKAIPKSTDWLILRGRYHCPTRARCECDER